MKYVYDIDRGYYIFAGSYEIYLRVINVYITNEQSERGIYFLTREDLISFHDL